MVPIDNLNNEEIQDLVYEVKAFVLTPIAPEVEE